MSQMSQIRNITRKIAENCDPHYERSPDTPVTWAEADLSEAVSMLIDRVEILEAQLAHCKKKDETSVYVVTMYRYGEPEKHSYVLGVWSTYEAAIKAGDLEKEWRGNKYLPTITKWEIDGNEFGEWEIDGIKFDRIVTEGKELK